MCIDAKAFACTYDIPLVSINGRDNNGRLLTFFMGFIASEKKENYRWFLLHFRKLYRIPPKFMCLDHCLVSITAAKEVIPETHLMLDEYHLNINQLKHCQSLKAVCTAHIDAPEVNSALYLLRRSPTEAIFLERRTQFETQFL